MGVEVFNVSPGELTRQTGLKYASKVIEGIKAIPNDTVIIYLGRNWVLKINVNFFFRC